MEAPMQIMSRWHGNTRTPSAIHLDNLQGERKRWGEKDPTSKQSTAGKEKHLRLCHQGLCGTVDGPERQLCWSETEDGNPEGTGRQAKVGL